MNTADMLSSYKQNALTIGALGGHSGLDVAAGSKQQAFQTVVVAQKGRHSSYERYKTAVTALGDVKGCIDHLIVVEKFQDILQETVQEQLRELNTIFVHNRYFWVYFDDPAQVENNFHVPIFGSRHLVRLEERDEKYNQYHLLDDAGIRTPKIFASPDEIDRPVLVKASEAKRSYERAFFVAGSKSEWESIGSQLEADGKVAANWREATIEEFVVGAPVNFNFFYSSLTGELELLGTDTRRQTNLDGFLRMTTDQQQKALNHVDLKMIETGHIAVTIKESLVEKAYRLGQQFVEATQQLSPEIDPSQKGIIGPFALQGAVVAEDGKEDIVIFDVSLRIPGSPGTAATPYSGYLYGRPMSVGERCALEIKQAQKENRLVEIIT